MYADAHAACTPEPGRRYGTGMTVLDAAPHAGADAITVGVLPYLLQQRAVLTDSAIVYSTACPNCARRAGWVAELHAGVLHLWCRCGHRWPAGSGYRAATLPRLRAARQAADQAGARALALALLDGELATPEEEREAAARNLDPAAFPDLW